MAISRSKKMFEVFFSIFVSRIPNYMTYVRHQKSCTLPLTGQLGPTTFVSLDIASFIWWYLKVYKSSDDDDNHIVEYARFG